jgi:hypothetical protein
MALWQLTIESLRSGTTEGWALERASTVQFAVEVVELILNP